MTKQNQVQSRVDAIQWEAVYQALNESGWAMLPKLLDASECNSLRELYDKDSSFRNRIIMARHGYGKGEYRYFAYPVPAMVEQLRTALYSRLMPLANLWHELLRIEVRFPEQHAEFIQRCHEAGQLRPTPLLLQYGEGDFNCLHQDLYGQHQFPFQAAILLSDPQNDFEGGEFVLTEQRPRMQSRATVIPLTKGDAVVFAVNHRPARSVRGYYRMTLRHGVSTIRSGHRHTLGIIFHDAT